MRGRGSKEEVWEVGEVYAKQVLSIRQGDSPSVVLPETSREGGGTGEE